MSLQKNTATGFGEFGLPAFFVPLIIGRRWRVGAAAALLAGIACSDSTAPPTAASANPTATNAPSATAGLVMTSAPTFEVKDANGKTVGGVPVSVVVTAGGGTLTGAPTSSSRNGPTSVGTWTLGKTAGVNTLSVTVAGLDPIVISVMGTPGPAASIALTSGGDQLAFAGTKVPLSIVFQVRDQFGNGVPSQAVSFSVVLGGGVAASAPAQSDAAGNVTAPAWELGKSAVPQQLRATSGSFSATAGAIVGTDYMVDVRVFGPPMPPAAADAFGRAANRIRASIVGDVLDFPVQATPLNLENGCGVTGVTAFSDAVDDVVIYASVVSIDGPGKVLASAGPCYIRSGTFQSLIGVMRFDADDIDGLVASGRLEDVIQHEMLHVIGVGTLWRLKGVLVGAATPETRFTGAFGIGACIGLGGTSVCPGSVPVEHAGGPGTADSHWRESTFDNELMTGFVEVAGVKNHLSIITIESLGDIGYTSNKFAADNYMIPGLSAIAGTRAQILADLSPPPTWEIVMPPVKEISRSGTVRAVVLQ